jgi:molecular chaperone DnaK
MPGIIGIDFGTTNTLAAWMDGDMPVILPNDRGERSTPSVVALSESGETLVGVSAKSQSMADPASAVFGIKRRLGKDSKVVLRGRNMNCESLAATILNKVRRDAEAYLGFEIHDAVITVPARFSDPQRRAVREAARKAGIKAARIMNEPTAAALARAWAVSRDETERLVLVYDFGGGTFDATVLKARGGSCRVLASEGDDTLGGMDLDQALYGLARTRFISQYGINDTGDPYLSRMLTDLCEKAKIELSTRTETTISVPFLQGPGGVVHPSLRISRAEFEELALPYVQRSLLLVERVLTEAGVESSEVDALVLSGGSSRIPLVSTMLKEAIGRIPDTRVNPEEVVALGAAIEAARLEGRLTGLSFSDVCSRTFGLEIDGGRFVSLIKKNEALPATGRKIFTTVEDFQKSVEMHVLQGDGSMASTNVSVGRFLLPGIRKAPKGDPRIMVEFSIDEGDMLMVKAKDLDTGAEQSVVLFDGTTNSLPPIDRVLSLADRARRESSGAVMDSSLSMELDELLASAADAARMGDETAAADVSILLEGLLGELSARSGLSDQLATDNKP